ncbi:MAG: SDR family NAD(P)-dependent oxidoreductase [Archangiaceae bacterium]|nr:SDR family NAD(P)-dependent oxidoreductase [Archangiaceae bacterium]
MSKNLVIVGAGPGISLAVAKKFGAAGFSVALVARNAGKLSDLVKQLEAAGVKATAIPADASDPAAVRSALQQARKAFGPITVLQWNPALGTAAQDLLTTPLAELRATLDVGVTSLVGAIQEALPDLKQQGKESAVLVTNGGFGLFADQVDQIAVDAGSMGLGVANAAKHKASRLLARRLHKEGVYYGELMVVSTVKGTLWDRGQATLEASAVAERYWKMYQGRSEALAQIG